MFARTKSLATTVPVAVRPPAGPGHEALRLLDDNGLEHSTDNFSLAVRWVTERGGVPAMAVDAVLMEGRWLRQSDVDRILAADRHGRSRGTEDGVMESGREALRHQTLRLAGLTADAASSSSAFGAELTGDLCRLVDGEASVGEIVRAMVERTRVVEGELRSASRRVEELREQVEASRDDARRDALTGLLNRRGAMHELAVRRSAPGVVAVCDVDHFKPINDRFGHGVGDRVLKGVAASLANSVGVHTVARWGGEEFVIILDGSDVGTAGSLLERARADLEARTFRLRDTAEPLGAVTVSIGAAPLGGVDPEAAVEAADRMLYEAKRAGRNRVAMPLGRR